MKPLRDTVVLIIVLALVWLLADHVTGEAGMRDVWRGLAMYLSAVAGLFVYVVVWSLMEEFL